MLYSIVATLLLILVYFISPISTASYTFQKRRVSDLGGQIGPVAHCILGSSNVLLMAAGAYLAFQISDGTFLPDFGHDGFEGFQSVKHAWGAAYQNYRSFTQGLDFYLFGSWLTPVGIILPFLEWNQTLTSALVSFILFWLNADFALKIIIAYPFITILMICLQAVTSIVAFPLKIIIARYKPNARILGVLDGFIVAGWSFEVLPLMIGAYLAEAFLFVHLLPLISLMIIPSAFAFLMGRDDLMILIVGAVVLIGPLVFWFQPNRRV